MASPCLNIFWSPEATDANNYLSVQFRRIHDCTSLNYRQPRMTGVFIEECNNLLTVTAPNCTTIEGHGNTDFQSIEPIQICFCNSLQSISFSALEYLRTGAWINDLPALTSLDFSSLVELDVRIPSGGDQDGIIIQDCPSLTSLSFDSLTTITSQSSPTSGWRMLIYNNPALASLSLPNLVFPNGAGFYFPDNALSQSSVDAILARAVANAGYVTGTIVLGGTGNAAPSAGGLASKATLIGRGVTVTTN